jgi:hypothetical protein
MKKRNNNGVGCEDTMRAEYDFSGGVRGKHCRALRDGYTITIRKGNGKTVVKEVRPKAGVVVLDPDVREYFPNSDSVNTLLRSLIRFLQAKPKARTQ